MRKRTFAAVASVAGGLGIAAALAVSAVTGEALGALPVPTLTVTTPLATATVAVPPPPPVTTTVTATTPVATATVALPPPPPPIETVVSAVTTAVAPVTTTATSVVGAAGGSAPSTPSVLSAPASAQSASSQPGAAGAGGTSVVAGTPATAAAPTATQVRAAPTLRARRQPGRDGARRLVLTLRRPRELTVLFRGPGDTCRVAGRLVVQGRRGKNVVPLNGHVRGGRLAAGVFRIEVVDTTGSARRVVGKLAVSLRYGADGRPHVRQVRYVPRDCAFGAAALLASSRPVAGERMTAGPTSPQRAGETSSPVADEPVDVDRSGDGGGLAALPNLAPDDAVGGVAAMVLVALLVLSAGAFLYVAGSSAARSLRR